ncbi:hypothetical protein ACFP77_22620, partial [Shinella zoogloeoides]
WPDFTPPAAALCRRYRGRLLHRRSHFTSGNFGYASTIAYAIAALAVVISMVQLWLTREPK